MPPRNDKTAGFSIIEVLVAFVILAMVVTMCLQVYSNSARAETMARWSEQAHAMLRDRLASLTTLGLQPGQQLEGVGADGLRWAIAVGQPANEADNGRGIVWITAQVTDPSGHAYTAYTARWLGEAFPVAEQ